MLRKRSSITAIIQFLPMTILCGCAAVGTGPVALQPLPPDPGPVCADSQTDPKGPAECQRRLFSFIRRNIAATVTVTPLAYSAEQGNSLQKIGTGAVISPDGLVLTAYHVVKDAEYIMAQIRGANLVQGIQVIVVRTVPMDVVGTLPEKDLALLRPRHPTEFPLYLEIDRDWQPAPDMLLWHFGQTSLGLRGAVQNWPVSEPQLRQDGLATLKVACRSGDSGGPVVSLDGRLVGIILASVENEDLTYFLPIGEAVRLLPMPPAEDKTPAGPAPASGSR